MIKKIMKKATMMVITVVTVLSSIQLPVFAMGETTIDSGTSYAYDVSNDATGKVEDALPNGYVQATGTTMSLQKNTAYGFGTIYNDEVNSVKQISDTRYLVLTRGTQASPLAERGAAVYLVNDKGEALSSIALRESYVFASEVWEASGRYNVFVSKGASLETMVFIYNSEDDTLTQSGVYLETSISSLSGIGGTTNRLMVSAMIDEEIYLSGQKWDNLNTGDGSTTRMYGMNTNAGLYGAFMIDKYNQVRTANSTAYITFEPQMRRSQAGFVGLVRYGDTTYWDEVQKIYNWDAQKGSSGFNQSSIEQADQNPMTIKSSYTATVGSGIKFMSISTQETLYFLESCDISRKTCPSKLYRWDLTKTDAPTLLGTYPAGTTFDIIVNTTGSSESYLFYGNVSSYTDVFAKFDGVEGLAVGYMNSSFVPVKMGSVKADGYNKVAYAQVKDSGDILLIGSTSGRNLIADNHMYPNNRYPADQASSYGNGFAVTLKKAPDYAPGLQVDNALTINKDNVTDWDALLLAGVNSYDVFDFYNGWSATDLNNRINRNPNKWDAAIDWQGLGLDTSKIGPNTVKYFVNDSQLQETATSRIVNIIADSTNVDGDKLAMQVSTFAISVADAKDLTAIVAKNKAGVVAWRLSDGTDLKANVAVDQSQLNAIQSTTESKVMPLTFTLNDASTGGTVSATVNVFIYDTNTIIDDNNKEAISAKPFTVDVNEVAALNDQAIITKADAKAWSTETMSSVPVQVTNNGIQAAVGVYDVAFATSKGTSKVIKVTVKDKDTVIGNEDALYATHFTIDISEFDSLTDANILSKSQARAWKLADGSTVDIRVTDRTALMKQAGIYSVVLETALGTQKPIYVTVKDDNTVIGDKDALYARNFAIDISAFDSLDDTLILTQSNAHAWLLQDGSSVAVTVKNRSALVKAIGTYGVELATTNGTAKTIYVTVKDNNTVINNNSAVYARDFTLDISEVDGLTNAGIIAKAQARGWNTNDGSELAVQVSQNGIQKAVGAYAVTLAADEASITITVTVKDADTNVDPGKGEAIYAKDFVLDSSEVNGLTDATIINKAGAKAWSLDNGNALAVTVKSKNIQATAGVYDVTFTTANGMEISVKATVKDENTVIGSIDAIYAEDFTVDISEAAGLSDTSIISMAQARAWMLGDGTDVVVTVKTNGIQPAVGTYNVTFTTANNTEITISATVKDGDTHVDPVTVEAMYAKDFILDISEVNGLSDAAIINKAGARAWSLRDGSSVVVTVKENHILPGAGAYDVVFATATGTQMTVTATVKDEHTIVDPENGEAIYAEHFTVALNDVAGLNDTTLISKAGARAWKLSDGSNVTVQVANNGVQAAVGSYDVRFTTTAGTEKTVRATVYDEDAVIGNDDVIYAKDFMLDVSEVTDLTDAALIAKAEVRAWNIADGSNVPVSVQSQNIQAAAGAYTVTFKTINGTEMSVTATVKDGDTHVEPVTGEAMYAKDFTLDISEANSLSDATIISKAEAKAWKLSDGSVLAVSVRSQNIQEHAGAYDVVFATAAGTKITVTATVKDANTEVDPEKGEAIYAEDFVVQGSEVAALDNAAIINKAAARAWSLADGSEVAVSVKTQNIQERAGAYDIVLTTVAGTEMTVTATVEDDNTHVDPLTGEAIYAHNFVIDVAEVASVDNAALISKAQARAWSLRDGSLVAVRVKTNMMAAKLGTYPVTYTTAAGTELTVQATVVDSDTVIGDEDAIAAKDFVVDSSEVSSLNDAVLVEKASAQAWSLDDGSPVTVTVTENDIEVAAGAYDVTFATRKGTSVTVTATVTDEHTVAGDKDAIYAEGFVVDIAEVHDLDDAAVIHRAGARAWKLSDGSDVAVSVKTNNIVAAVGTYSVTFTTANGTENMVRVSVKDADTNIDPTTGEAIYARDFTVDASEVASLDNIAIIAKAEARAWNLADSADVAVMVKEHHMLPGAGAYDVVFTTAAGTEMTVTATVKDEHTVVGDKDAIYAEDFTIEVAEVNALDDTELIAISGARAWLLSDGSAVTVNVKENSIIEAVGNYDVVFSTENGTTITVTASVIDEHVIIDPEVDTALYAHGFEVTIDEAAVLDEAQAIVLAEAKAWKLSDGSEIALIADISAVQATLGVYPVIFTTNTGVSQTVYVSVIDETVVIQDGIALSATDYTAPVSDYQTRNLERAKLRANVKAWDIQTGEDFTAQVALDYYNQIDQLTYKVNFKVERSTGDTTIFGDDTDYAAKLVTVTLYDDGSGLPDTGQNTIVWMLAGAAMIASSLGGLTIIRGRNRKNEGK